MPHPIPYIGGQDEDLTRSIDAVHIEPSIREGLVLVPSLYGKGASFPLIRLSPVNTALPFITGNTVAPGLLTCEEGTWYGAPRPQFAYQWMSNGEDIPFATNRTWMSDVSYEDKEITCEVRGFSIKGQMIVISTSVTITLVEPTEVQELETFAVRGLGGSKPSQVIYDDRLGIMSGRAAEDRMDTVRSTTYIPTGLASEPRNDVIQKRIIAVTGLGRKDNLNIQNDPGTMIINQQYADPLVESVAVPMNLGNGDAEFGTLGWSSFGKFSYTSEVSRNGTYSFWGGRDNAPADDNLPYTYQYQDVPIEPIWIPDVDAGVCGVEFRWFQNSFAGADLGNIKVEFLDEFGDPIDGDAGPGLFGTPASYWFYREGFADIPIGTRTVRLFVEFALISGSETNAYVEDISLMIRKGPYLSDRDFGPDFKFWRVNFFASGAYSGGALGEIEFRESIGGADQCTGGTPVFGSAGNGKTNANEAFDDLRNSGYWAGASGAIGAGTSWIGYDFPVEKRIREIDITARLGSAEALQVPQAFFVEGSDDGQRWHRVQQYDIEQVPSFTSNQQRQFEVKSGAFPYHFNIAGETATFYLNKDVSQRFIQRGSFWRSSARQNITHACVLGYADGPEKVFDYRFEFVRHTFGKNANDGGMVLDIHERGFVPNAALTSTPEWHEYELTNPFELEVGDIWGIIVTDMGGGSDYSFRHARIPAIDNYTRQGAKGDHFATDKVNRYMDRWDVEGQQENDIGSLNARPGVFYRYAAIDFKGTYF